MASGAGSAQDDLSAETRLGRTHHEHCLPWLRLPSLLDGRKGVVHLVLELKDDRIAAELLDNGIAFNSLGVDVPELSDDIDEVRIGGPGLKFVRTYVDRLDYRRDSELNRLRLEKDLKAAG